jgi:hypothetical protein
MLVKSVEKCSRLQDHGDMSRWKQNTKHRHAGSLPGGGTALPYFYPKASPPPLTLQTLNSVRKSNLRDVRTFIQFVSIILCCTLSPLPTNHVGLRKMQVHCVKLSGNFPYSVTPLQIVVAARLKQIHRKVVGSNRGWAVMSFNDLHRPSQCHNRPTFRPAPHSLMA